MAEKIVLMKNGFEASQAALFVQSACKFESKIILTADTKTANAKSIMGIISLGMLDGLEVTVIAEGADAEQAINVLSGFLANLA